MGKPENTRRKSKKSIRGQSGDDDEPYGGVRWPHIPPGPYTAYCLRTELATTYGGRRNIFIHFKIWDGEHAGNVIFMACTFPRGRISPSSKYYKQWAIAQGRRPEERERLARNIFPRRLYRVQVRDTKSNETPVRDSFVYSVVDTIIESITGGSPL